MALSVKHPFNSAKADGGDATRVRPSNWNAEHTLTAALDKVIGTDGASTTVKELSCTAAGRALLDDPDAAAQKVTLGVAEIPIGGSFDWWTDTLPAAVGTTEFGWLNGQAISRATYSALFALWGTTFGAGDGATTFNVPDTCGRTTAGSDDMGGIASKNRLTGVAGSVNGDVLGAAGGEEAHALTEGELASHSHAGSTSSDGAHTHTVGISNAGGGYQIGGIGAHMSGTTTTSSNGSHTHSVTINNTGGGGAHNNVQPTIICNKVARFK